MRKDCPDRDVAHRSDRLQQTEEAELPAHAVTHHRPAYLSVCPEGPIIAEWPVQPSSHSGK